jgi:hypothetical protein
MILALTVPLMAQEVEAKEDAKDVKIVMREKHDKGDIRRGMERRRMGADRKKMHKKQQIKNVVRLAVVGGLAYYIGYHQGEKHFNGGMMKRRLSFGDKK